MADKSSELKNDLPEEEIQSDNLSDDGNEATEGLSIKEEDKEENKEKLGFQRLVAKKDLQIKQLNDQLLQDRQRLSALERQEREKKLNEMDEVEKWKTIANENLEKASKAELKSFVSSLISKNKLDGNPIAELILETPWAAPSVKRKLSAKPTWEETIEVVKSELPSYLESLTPDNKVETETKSIEEIEGMETERSSQKPSSKRIWTKAEVQTYLESSKDPQDFRKREKLIQDALTEGRIR